MVEVIQQEDFGSMLGKALGGGLQSGSQAFVKEAVKQDAKQAEADKKKMEEQSKLTATIGELVNTIPFVGPGKWANYFSEEGREKRQYFDTLSMQLEEIAAGMVGRGTLSQRRFQYLLKNLPSSTKTQAANRGALKAWSQVLGVDFPGASGEDEVNEEVSIKESGPDGVKELTADIAKKFLKASGNNKDKAREMAKKHGYSF